MRRIIPVIILILAPSLLLSQSQDTLINPCKDKLYLQLQQKNLDSLSEREYQYYLEKMKQCNEYIKYSKQLKTKEAIETSSGNGPAILIICIVGIAFLGVIGYLVGSKNGN